MVQMRRWGKEYVDRRNWKEYNESRVRRGEILLDFDMLDEWEEELKKMNQAKAGKSGARYRYPEPFMRLLAYLHILFHLPFFRRARALTSFVLCCSQHPGGGRLLYSPVIERHQNVRVRRTSSR